MWISQSFLMLVILLNFIIAVISSTYNKVQDYKMFIKFQAQALLNKEYQEVIKIVKTSN